MLCCPFRVVEVREDGAYDSVYLILPFSTRIPQDSSSEGILVVHPVLGVHL